ncbi:MAG TPA: M28 family peptidase, partial [Xanthobacteraceae bacterium]|nr:M28 family peptidase [Xanthobacteraceae bacterium]
MKPDSRCVLAMVLGVLAVSAGPACAQTAPPATAAQNAARNPATLSRPTGRFGRTLGLPKDGKDLFIADEDYIRFPLPPGEEAYADVDAMKIKATIGEITAISRRSRDDGNQYWGRIPGTPYDRMMQDWVMSRFKALGMQDVRRQPIAMKPLWYPTVWTAEFSAGGKTVPLKSAFPITESRGTKGPVSAPVVWVGLGTAADFRGRDVAGKAVMIYSIATPGGRDHSADWSGAVKRADEAGAAIIMVEMGFPGDSQSEPEGAVGARAPTITITPDDANLIRDRLDDNVEVQLHLRLDTEEREGLETADIWGVLPGASNEQILIMAHTDAFFEGAMDNASGIAMMLDIARHYGALAPAQRPRTLVFLTTSDHHHGSAGIRSVRDNYDWSKVALIVNSEHPSQTLLYDLDAGLMTANEVSARRWYVGGSDALRTLVRNSFREFGVATYHKSEVSPGGE